MQEILLNSKKRSNLNVIDFMHEAELYAVRGSGVTDIQGPDGEKAYAFNGTGEAYFQFPQNKKTLFEFINKPFELELVLWLNSTGMVQFLGNLRNGNGTSDYSFTLNNQYEVLSKLSLDGAKSSSIYRYRFGTGNEKLPTNRWFKLKIRRRLDNTTMDFLVDDILISSLTNVNTFDIGLVNLFRIGTTIDGQFAVSGKIAKLVVTAL